MVRKFHTILTAVAKMSKECVLRLTADNIFLISSEPNSVLGGPSAWGEIDKDKLFSDYHMEGVSSEDNEIYIEFSPDAIHKNLTTLKSPSVRGMKLKLTKRNNAPNLTFEVNLGGATSTRQVVHDVPVAVLQRKYWSDYKVASLPPVNVSLTIEDIKRFRTMLEKYKSIGSVLCIQAFREGSLNLSIETDEVKVSGTLKNLKSPILRPGAEPWELEEMDVAKVKVDIKRMNHFLAAEMINPEKVVLNIVHQSLVHILMVSPEMSFQIFIPKSGRF
jgi:HUS1 checkpoint protein